MARKNLQAGNLNRSRNPDSALLTAPAASLYSPISRPERTALPASPSGGPLLPHLPWLAAILIAPFWFGGVGAGAQSVTGGLVALSLFFCAPRLKTLPASLAGRTILCALAALILLAILPLPAQLVRILSPGSFQLAREFPLPRSGANTLAIGLAPGPAIVRAWQLAIFAAVLLLAKEAVRIHRFTTIFSRALAVAVLLQGLAELWFLYDGRGIWQHPRNYPGGTFANRSHFADWMTVAAMFLLGPLMRRAKALRNAERARSDLFDVLLLALAVLTGVGTTLASASRGGALVLGVGTCVWALILRRSRERGLGLAVFAFLLAGSAVLFGISGGLLMGRISQDGGIAFKLHIWRDALNMFERFPLFGVGLGGFETGFNHFKMFYGHGTFLFAENEYLEWLVETGLIGAALAGAAVFLLIRPLLTNAVRHSKREFFYGGIAALSVFAAHAFFEFVFHVTACALLASAILGMVIGTRDREIGPALPAPPSRAELVSTLALSLVILLLAGTQTVAAEKWRRSQNAENPDAALQLAGEAVRLWPEKRHALATARSAIEAVQKGRIAPERGMRQANAALSAALHLEPYDWELRLEQAWLDLAFSPDHRNALAEAKRVSALNPLQPAIPLRFAQVLAKADPLAAMDFLRHARPETAEEIRASLRTAWEIEQKSEVLWEVTPVTPLALKLLGEFAAEKGLTALAMEAETRSAQVASSRPSPTRATRP